MRVISGKAKGHRLKSPKAMTTRPTSDRLKETLFNIIQANIHDSLVLDLFAGTGALGIEALSRGARQAYFVEKDIRAIDCIRENLKKTRLDHKGIIIHKDFQLALANLEGIKFDLLFIDPPYDSKIDRLAIDQLLAKDLLNIGALLVIEADKKTDFTFIKQYDRLEYKEKIFKTNKFVFIEYR